MSTRWCSKCGDKSLVQAHKPLLEHYRMILGGPFVPFGGFVIPCPDFGGACVPNIRDA
jgi:hypothetical protein